MKHQLLFYFRSLLCCFLLLLPQFKVFASHILGGELFYTHVSGNTYKITCIIYFDCSPTFSSALSTFPTSHPQICVYNGSTLVQQVSLNIQAPDTGKEVTTMCTGDTSQCTNPASTIPGILKFVYSANVTLPSTSPVWRFVFTSNMGISGSGAGRTPSTNLGGGTLLQLIDTLNNNVAPNSSPILSDTLQTTYCINQVDVFKPHPIDPDNDSIVAILSPATNATGTCGSVGDPCTYIGTAWPGTPISATVPFMVLPDSLRINSRTGEMTFYPNAFQRADINYNIREFRWGVLVGTSQHEFTFSVVTCPGTFPCLIDSCNGTPDVGTIHATPNMGCTPLATTLYLTGSSFGRGIGYQWQSSPDNIIWNSIPDATNDTLHTTVISPAYYRAIISCAKSGKRDTSANTYITVDTPSIPIVSLSAFPGTSIMAGQYDTIKALVTGGVLPTYKWYINGSLIPTATTPTLVRHTFADGDSVACVVTNNTTCGYSSFNLLIISVSGHVGIAPVIDNEQITILPNPNKGIFTIKGYTGISEKISVEIINTVGQTMYKHYCMPMNSSINEQLSVADLPTGIYFLKINGATIKKFLKE